METTSEMEQIANRILVGLARTADAIEHDDNAIRVWPFEDAPDSLREMSAHDGDESWVAWVPPGKPWPEWAYSGGAFGGEDVHDFQLPDGATVLIGAHT